MKKILTLTMLVLVALLALSVNVNAVNVTSEAELNAALAGTDANLVVTGDFEIETSIRTNKDFTLDLNGHKVTGPDDGAANWYAFIVESNTFTLKDTSAEKTGELYAKCYGVETKGGTFVMESGKITATRNGGIGCAVVNYGGKVEIKGGTLVGSISAINMQAYFADATTTISGGILIVAEGGDAAFIVGGEYSQKTEVATVTGGTFDGEKALLVASTPNLSIIGGKFSSDVSEYVDSKYAYDEGTGEIVCAHTDLEKHEEIPATYDAEGTKAYYECNTCEKLFEDEDATSEITDRTTLVIPVLEKEEESENNEENDTVTPPTGEGSEGIKEEAKEEVKEEAKDESPKTGAKSFVVFFIVVAFLGIAISKKERGF